MGVGDGESVHRKGSELEVGSEFVFEERVMITGVNGGSQRGGGRGSVGGGEGRGGVGRVVVEPTIDTCLMCLRCVLPASWRNFCFVDESVCLTFI